MKLHTARITVYCLTAFTVLAGLIAIMTQSTAPIIVTVAGLAAELTVFFAFVKCPHCVSGGIGSGTAFFVKRA